MRVLIIGGTRFVGRHLAEATLARGHELVLFNRGTTNPGLFPDVPRVLGDRRLDGFGQLRNERFDVIFDTSTYHPEDVAATRPLAARAGQYTFVSSASVYRGPIPASADEAAPVWKLHDPLPRQFATPAAYGGLKARCELAALEMYAGRACIVRPGLIVGPYDYTDRLAAWARRLTQRRTLLAAEADQPLQLIDARDLAAFLVRAAESGLSGVFNAVGPSRALNFGAFLRCAAAALGVRPAVLWAGDEFLISSGVTLPLWVPRVDHAFFQLSNARATAAGLVLRPLEATVADVQASLEATSARPGVGGLTDEQEERLLATLVREDRARQSGRPWSLRS